MASCSVNTCTKYVLLTRLKVFKKLFSCVSHKHILSILQVIFFLALCDFPDWGTKPVFLYRRQQHCLYLCPCDQRLAARRRYWGLCTEAASAGDIRDLVLRGRTWPTRPGRFVCSNCGSSKCMSLINGRKIATRVMLKLHLLFLYKRRLVTLVIHVLTKQN